MLKSELHLAPTLGWRQYQDVNPVPTSPLTDDVASALLSYFSFQPVLHDWFNKGSGMYYPVCSHDAYKITLAANQKE